MTRGWGVLLGLVFAVASAAGPVRPGISIRPFARELAAHGRAEATLRFSAPSPLGAPRELRGALALEPPGRARLEIPATGEVLTLRPDGGEWKQPATRQVLHYSAAQGAQAVRWWGVLLGAEATLERRLADGRVRLWITASGDSADLWLDAHGRPARLVVPEESGGGRYVISGWRFRSARGAAAFRIATPPDWDTVELP